MSLRVDCVPKSFECSLDAYTHMVQGTEGVTLQRRKEGLSSERLSGSGHTFGCFIGTIQLDSWLLPRVCRLPIVILDISHNRFVSYLA